MTLKEWIKDRGITQRKAAALLKTDPPTLSRWLSDTFKPNLERAYKIEKATKGAVPMWTWVSKKPPYVVALPDPEALAGIEDVNHALSAAQPEPQGS